MEALGSPGPAGPPAGRGAALPGHRVELRSETRPPRGPCLWARWERGAASRCLQTPLTSRPGTGACVKSADRAVTARTGTPAVGNSWKMAWGLGVLGRWGQIPEQGRGGCRRMKGELESWGPEGPWAGHRGWRPGCLSAARPWTL